MFPTVKFIQFSSIMFAGVEWIDEDRLMLASDRAKADQPYICTTRDQSVHIMVLPHGHRKVGRAPAAPKAAASEVSRMFF